jgi:YbgC/YbaW family acyl-CoA thioester hydrolase
VRHHEADAVGYVNNAAYLHYLEQAAIEHSAAVGYPLGRYREMGTLFIVRRHQIEHLRPASPGDVLEVGESRVRQRLSEGTLYGVKAGRENRLPAFQFEGGKEVPGIAQVLKRIDRSLHPVTVLNWFMLPNPDLFLDEEEANPVSPRYWLLSGGDPEVLVRLAGEL